MENDVRALREAKGLTQAQLGEAVGVSRQSINSIEKGRYDPSLPLAIAIARYFGKAVEEIFHVRPAREPQHTGRGRQAQ
ncbi:MULTISPECIES: helix-turn-helix transcriptional regulator [Actinomyces]|uniref:helix-turn-helix transcriptional regulator n=1 Tax=Actinomyces TaxID=1654 RepID=UPI0010A227A1|nr:MULTISPECIES: helix-turn-helix transcriptional regulator [Actinomyces]